MSRALAAAVLALASAASAAHADIWQRALAPAAADAADTYQRALREGDEHAQLAATHAGSLATIREQVQRSVQAYRRAAAARPEAAEPHYRIGAVLYAFYLQTCEDDPQFGLTRSPLADCSAPDAINPQIAELALQAWGNFEAKAPLDPRLSGGPGSILFSRALIHTKLATPAHLQAAARDYEAILQRSGRIDRSSEVWGNLAETYMMIGQLDEAIDTYKLAVRNGGHTSTWYGLAVALDRDGRGALARDLIAGQRITGYRQFRRSVERSEIFFVPRGEVFYYFALAEEAFGRTDEALDYWNHYLASGAHPQYQPRAREHVAELLAKKRAGAGAPPVDPFMELR